MKCRISASMIMVTLLSLPGVCSAVTTCRDDETTWADLAKTAEVIVVGRLIEVTDEGWIECEDEQEKDFSLEAGDCFKAVRVRFLVHGDKVLKGSAAPQITFTGELPVLYGSICGEEPKLEPGLGVVVFLERTSTGLGLMTGYNGLGYTDWGSHRRIDWENVVKSASKEAETDESPFGDDEGKPHEHEETVTDADGNVYHTVTIDSQVWLAENLRTTRYLDGTPIQRVADDEAWSVLTTGAYCSPEVDASAPESLYGLLYNFHAVSDSRALCPQGWHVPTAAEWRLLVDQLGGVEVAGGKVKAVDSGLWKVHVEGTTNESGFSAVPAGGRGRLGPPGDAGYYATWWSSTSHDGTYAWHWGLYPDKHAIRSNPGHKASGFSVRCVKD